MKKAHNQLNENRDATSMNLKEFQRVVISKMNEVIQATYCHQRYLYWDFLDSGKVKIQPIGKTDLDVILKDALIDNRCTSLGWCWISVKESEVVDRYVVSFAWLKPDFAFNCYYIIGEKLVKMDIDESIGILVLKKDFEKIVFRQNVRFKNSLSKWLNSTRMHKTFPIIR
jgi:hypothetical protein